MSEELVQLINRILSLSPENLKREGKDYQFDDVYPFIKEIFEYIGELKRNEDFLVDLPDSWRTNLFNTLNNFAGVAEQIASFSPTTENPQALRDNLSNQIRSIYEILFNQLIQPLKIFLVERRTGKVGVAKVSKKIEDELRVAQKRRKEMDELLQSVKIATARVGFTEYSKVFGLQAKKHNDDARKWLITSIVVFIVASIFLGVAYVETTQMLVSNTKPDSMYALTIFLAKFLPSTLLYYALYQTLRNYNASKHLYTLNKHRENILKTFQSFVSSTDDPKIKDSLLKEAAKAIFAAGDTGYLLNQDRDKNGLDLIQIVNDLTKKEN